MIAALSFLLDYEKIEDDDSDDSDSEHELAAQQPQVVVNKEAMYKVGCFVLNLPILLLSWSKLGFLRDFLPKISSSYVENLPPLFVSDSCYFVRVLLLIFAFGPC